jgi:hypothetical protein
MHKIGFSLHRLSRFFSDEFRGTADGYLNLKAAKAYCEAAARSLSDLRETE